MDKKTLGLVYSKTKMFVIIVALVILFQKVFGEQNILIGVTTITAALMFLERDLRVNIRKYFVLFLGINLFQGVCTFLAVNNVWLGLFLNFISMFIVGYLFTYNLRTPMYIGFGLQYIFMWAMPVTLSELPMRLLALVVGAFSIALTQIIGNRKRFSKVTENTIPVICDALSRKIDKIINKEDIKDIENDDRVIFLSIKGLRKEILEGCKELFYLSTEGKVNFNISVALERITILSDKLINLDDTTQLKLLSQIKDMLRNLSLVTKEKDKSKEVVDSINIIIKEYEKCSNEKYVVYEMLNILDFLKHSLEQLASLSDKEYKKIRKPIKIPREYKKIEILKKEFNKNSLRFSYALRVSILVSLSIFAVNYFNIPDGRWIVYTVFSITQPYKHIAEKKSWGRVKGTIIGVVIVCGLFFFIKDNTARVVVVLLASYINSYIGEYDKQMIFITICALGSAAMSGDTTVLVIHRVIYILTGMVIAYIGNKLILPYPIEKTNRHLIKQYIIIQRNIMMEALNALQNNGAIIKVRNLLMKSSLIEEKLSINSTITKTGEIEKFLDNERILRSDLYELYLSVNKKSEKDISKKVIENVIEKILSYTGSNRECLDEIKETIANAIKNAKHQRDRLILINLWEINNKIHESYEIAMDLNKK